MTTRTAARRSDAPSTEWSGPGPLLPAGLRASVAAALKELGAALNRDLGLPRDFVSSKATLARSVAEGEAALLVVPPADVRAVAIALQAARHAQHQLEHLEIERGIEAVNRLNACLARLEEHPESATDLLSAVPELACRLGFDRALVSRVKGGVWYPELMFITGGDVEWAERITTAGSARPGTIRAGMPEFEVVKGRQSVVVTGVRHTAVPRSGPQAMIKASGTHSYVAAPIVFADDVVGMLHADCYGTRREVDALDRELLDAFCVGLRSALARCVLNEQLSAARSKLHQLTDDLRQGSGALGGGMPAVHSLRPPGRVATKDALVRRARQESDSDLLPPSLTERELQVLRLMAAGCTNTAIGEQLLIADGTVKKHVFHILRKLEVANRSEAVARWFRCGGAVSQTGRRATD